MEERAFELGLKAQTTKRIGDVIVFQELEPMSVPA